MNGGMVGLFWFGFSPPLFFTSSCPLLIFFLFLSPNQTIFESSRGMTGEFESSFFIGFSTSANDPRSCSWQHLRF